MPSSGKSTLGRALAERLGKRFVDLDEEIVKADGRSIPDIFAAEGEAGFRKLEAAQTARFARENRQVISCGGGVVKDPANLRALHANGIVLFIDRPLEDLLVGRRKAPFHQPRGPENHGSPAPSALSGGSGCCDPQQDHPCGCRDGGNGGAG